MKPLAAPSPELVRQLLTEVAYDRRLVGYRLHPRLGPTPVSLYSFAEVVGFLDEPHPRLDFQQLQTWVAETLGDLELAATIAEQIAAGASGETTCRRLRDLLALRLSQCPILPQS